MFKKILILFVTLLAFAHAETTLDKTALAAFSESIQTLQAELIQFCETENATAPLVAWQQVAIRWFNVQSMQLPAAEFMQTEFAYIFWPDPKDRLRKQVLTATEIPPSIADWATLPASIKSLSSVEFLLLQDEPKHYCDWYSVILDDRLKQATQLEQLGRYYDFTTAEHLTALHGSALTLHMILKEVLSRPGKTMWVLAPAWRSESGATIANSLVQQNVELLNALTDNHEDVADWVEKLSMAELLDYSTPRAEIEQLNSLSEALAAYVESTLAPALDVYIGFNNFDGD